MLILTALLALAIPGAAAPAPCVTMMTERMPLAQRQQRAHHDPHDRPDRRRWRGARARQLLALHDSRREGVRDHPESLHLAVGPRKRLHGRGEAAVSYTHL